MLAIVHAECRHETSSKSPHTPSIPFQSIENNTYIYIYTEKEYTNPSSVKNSLTKNKKKR